MADVVAERYGLDIVQVLTETNPLHKALREAGVLARTQLQKGGAA